MKKTGDDATIRDEYRALKYLGCDWKRLNPHMGRAGKAVNP